MVDFIGDNDSAVEPLKRICDIIQAEGGFVNPYLTVECKGGDLRILGSPDIQTGKHIIHLPQTCLLPVDGFELSLDQDTLVIQEIKPEMSRVQQDLLKAVIDLFNKTDKIVHHRTRSLFSLYYKDRPFLHKILGCRSYEELSLYKLLQELDPERFLLKEFIQTRAVYNPEGASEKQGYYMVPLIDCLNYHPHAFPIDKIGAAGNVNGRGVRSFERNGECYISYGRFDAADTLLFFNYVEQESEFVRSIPLTLELPGGIIEIRSLLKTVPIERIPPQLQDIASYLPEIQVDADKRIVTLSHIMIPQQKAPYSMRRVLRLAINHLMEDPDAAQQEVLKAERKIIDANYKYYQEFLGSVDIQDSHGL